MSNRMLHVLFYVLTGLFLGVIVHRWAQRWFGGRGSDGGAAICIVDEEPGRALAEAVLSACLLELRRDDVGPASDAKGPRLPTLDTPDGDVGLGLAMYMSAEPDRTRAIRAYLDATFDTPESTERFALDVMERLRSSNARPSHLAETPTASVASAASVARPLAEPEEAARPDTPMAMAMEMTPADTPSA